jgi:8-oxo-dGTP diphosphatase
VGPKLSGKLDRDAVTPLESSPRGDADGARLCRSAGRANLAGTRTGEATCFLLSFLLALNQLTNEQKTQPTWPVVAGILLVDGEGRVLLQHRDANAPSSPNRWGTPGGHVEPGESPLDAARREVLEETGLRVGNEVTLFRHFYAYGRSNPPFSFVEDLADVPSGAGIDREVSVFYGPTAAREEELVLGEGDALAFFPPSKALKLQLATSTSYVLPLFLRSAEYRSLLANH